MIRICEAISEMTGRDQTLLDQEMVVGKLNRTMIGWANYFCLGPGYPVDAVSKIGYSDNQIHEENEHNRHGSFAQFCRLR